MENYIPKYRIIEATQWNKKGDHEAVRDSIEFDNVNKICEICSSPKDVHGSIRIHSVSKVVCPGDYIVKKLDNTYEVLKPYEFNYLYKKTSDSKDVIEELKRENDLWRFGLKLLNNEFISKSTCIWAFETWEILSSECKNIQKRLPVPDASFGEIDGEYLYT